MVHADVSTEGCGTWAFMEGSVQYFVWKSWANKNVPSSKLKSVSTTSFCLQTERWETFWQRGAHISTLLPSEEDKHGEVVFREKLLLPSALLQRGPFSSFISPFIDYFCFTPNSAARQRKKVPSGDAPGFNLPATGWRDGVMQRTLERQ